MSDFKILPLPKDRSDLCKYFGFQIDSNGPLLNKKQVLFLVLNVIETYNSFINYIDLSFVDIDIDINEPISIIKNVALFITK